MSEVVLYHHVQGITTGFLAFADQLRAAGHVVHTPDLFDGATFDSIDAGMDFAERVGFGELIGRGVDAAAQLPRDIVYAGMSFGVLPAQNLAQTRPGARGAVLIDACAPVTTFGESWPAGVPVQIHGMDADAFFAGEGDIDAARHIVADAGRSYRAELFVYPGDRHLFADASLASYDHTAADLMTRRVVAFLDTID